MKYKIIYVERRAFESVSIERVFDQIAADLPQDRFETGIQKMPYGNGFLDILGNLLFFRPNPGDIYHITGHVHYIALRLPKNKTVLTVHDLVFLHRRSGIRRFLLKKLFLDLPIRKLGFITAVSQATKDEIVKYTGCDPKKIRVIENPLIDGFDPTPLKPFDEKHPVILQIGTAANKNVPNLIKALRGLNCKLRIIGRLDAGMREELANNAVEFENIFDLDQEAMVKEYRNADIVAFCSTYEGFGLPIIEAQAMRTPVITSDLSPMKEVAGAGACLADPNDPASIQNGLIRIINEPAYRDELIQKGAENALRFNAKNAAMQYADLYELMLKG
jgi:glycosyltransferase involved in cell wall biosynthesis